jgi:hypothetical protein
MSGSVSIDLSGDEALVLFERLAGLGEAKVAVEEEEQRVLWRIDAVLSHWGDRAVDALRALHRSCGRVQR